MLILGICTISVDDVAFLFKCMNQTKCYDCFLFRNCFVLLQRSGNISLDPLSLAFLSLKSLEYDSTSLRLLKSAVAKKMALPAVNCGFREEMPRAEGGHRQKRALSE